MGCVWVLWHRGWPPRSTPSSQVTGRHRKERLRGTMRSTPSPAAAELPAQAEELHFLLTSPHPRCGDSPWSRLCATWGMV